MKNSRRAVRFGNRPAFIKKEKALDWEQSAMLQIKIPKEPYLGEVALIAHFYYANKRSDLDENLLKDMLQIKPRERPCLKIIKNDNQIKAHNTMWYLDKERPRVEFALITLPEYIQMNKLGDENDGRDFGWRA